DRGDDRQRPRLPRRPWRARQVRPLREVVRDAGGDEQGPPEARLQGRGPDDLRGLHAGHRHDRRSRSYVLSPTARLSPETIDAPDSRRNTSGEILIFVERLPPPRISQSSAMSLSST